MREKLYRERDVTDCALQDEMAGLVREAAEPRPAGDSVKAAIRRAATALRMPDRRVRRIWYREPDIAIGASEYLGAQRRMENLRLRKLEALRQQVAVLEAQYRDDRDAFEARTRELVGGFIPLLEKLGVVEARRTGPQEDGEG